MVKKIGEGEWRELVARKHGPFSHLTLNLAVFLAPRTHDLPLFNVTNICVPNKSSCIDPSDFEYFWKSCCDLTAKITKWRP